MKSPGTNPRDSGSFCPRGGAASAWPSPPLAPQQATPHPRVPVQSERCPCAPAAPPPPPPPALRPFRKTAVVEQERGHTYIQNTRGGAAGDVKQVHTYRRIERGMRREGKLRNAAASAGESCSGRKDWTTLIPGTTHTSAYMLPVCRLWEYLETPSESFSSSWKYVLVFSRHPLAFEPVLSFRQHLRSFTPPGLGG